MTLIKSKKPDLFLDYIRSVKKAVDHPHKIGEVYSQTYNKAEDGLRQFDYETGQYIDANDAGVPSLATKE
jgi:hypothetical protein